MNVFKELSILAGGAMKEPSPIDLLEVLFQPGDGLIELRALPAKRNLFVKPGDVRSVEQFIKTCARDNVYVGIATRKDPSSGALENCSALRALWVEIDFKDFPSPLEARAKIESFHLEPSVIVASGGGFHVYFVLMHAVYLHPENNILVKDILRGLAFALGADMASAEPARILRLPGTKNLKYEHQPTVSVVHRSEKRYELQDFFSLPDTPEPEKTQPPKPNGHDRNGLSPGDDFAVKTSWREILEACGARFSHRVGETDYWIRPGKKAQEGIQPARTTTATTFSMSSPTTGYRLHPIRVTASSRCDSNLAKPSEDAP